jgi:integrase
VVSCYESICRVHIKPTHGRAKLQTPNSDQLRALMSGTNLTRRHFELLLKKAGLPAFRLQDLRHTCATILLMAGKHPKFVHELLRHASIAIALDTCGHLIEGMDGGLADAMDDTL